MKALIFATSIMASIDCLRRILLWQKQNNNIYYRSTEKTWYMELLVLGGVY
jgi:hypothetical protein